MSLKLQEELLQRMARQPEEGQARVLDFMKARAPVAGEVSGKDMLKFSGAIGHADLQTMTNAIEARCTGTL